MRELFFFKFFFSLFFNVSIDVSTFLMSKMFCSIVVESCGLSVVVSKTKSSLVFTVFNCSTCSVIFFTVSIVAELAGPEGVEQELRTFLE